MSEQPAAGGAPNGAPAPEAPKPETMVPVSALQAERAARQASDAKLAKLEADAKTASDAAALDAGKARELYDGLKPQHDATVAELAALKAERKAEQDAIAARNTERKAALPEDLRDLVPDGLSPAATQAQLERLERKATALGPTAPAGTLRPAGPASGKQIPEECAAEAKAKGETPQWWFDNVWNKPEAIARRAKQKT